MNQSELQLSQESRRLQQQKKSNKIAALVSLFLLAILVGFGYLNHSNIFRTDLSKFVFVSIVVIPALVATNHYWLAFIKSLNKSG